jgi:aminopeptidase N
VAALKDEWFTTLAIGGKESCLSAMAHCKDEKVIKEVLLPLNFNISPPAAASDSVPAADVHVLAGAMAGDKVARPLLWAYLRDNWDHVNAKLGGNPIIVDRMIGQSLSKFNDTAVLNEIEAFFSGVSTKGFDRTLETAKDKIRGRAAYKKRDGEGVKAWLVENGYA